MNTAKIIPSTKKRAGKLDKSAQLSPTTQKGTNQPLYKKWAELRAHQINWGYEVAKYLKFEGRAWNYANRVRFCRSVITQIGSKSRTNYCNTRHCFVCERIRKAKRIDAYKQPINKIEHSYFLTLTVPNVQTHKLRECYNEMHSVWRQWRKNHNKYCKKNKIKMSSGMRVFEVTYNPITNTFHPHFHILIDTLGFALELKSYWLLKFKDANIKYQHITKTTPKENDEHLLELFAYTFKSVTDGFKTPLQTSQMISQLLDIRTIQPFGNLRKVKHSDEIDELESTEIDFKPITLSEIEWNWDNEFKDWRFEDELLSEIEWTEKMLTESMDYKQPPMHILVENYKENLIKKNQLSKNKRLFLSNL